MRIIIIIIIIIIKMNDTKSSKVPRYLCRSLQCWGLDGFDSSSDFQFLQSLSKVFGDRSQRAIYKWYHRHRQFSIFFFRFSLRVQVFLNIFAFFYFQSLVNWKGKIN